jgi:hypothetical protein
MLLVMKRNLCVSLQIISFFQSKKENVETCLTIDCKNKIYAKEEEENNQKLFFYENVLNGNIQSHHFN